MLENSEFQSHRKIFLRWDEFRNTKHTSKKILDSYSAFELIDIHKKRTIFVAGS